MAQQIWDEGRVVGLSAYELYVKEYLTQNPNGTPLSQSQWLANTILSGNSLLVKVNANVLSTDDFIYNIALPSGCPLYAANTVVGSFFLGKGHYESGSNVANWVESYGPLLPNSSLDPENPANPEAYANTSITSLRQLGGDYSSYESKLHQYLSIADGIIIQPGAPEDPTDPSNSGWVSTDPSITTPGYILNKPSGKPILRLYLPNATGVEFDFEILLTGFTDNSLVTSYQAPMPTNLQTSNPLSGDFLGPAIRPWANKVIFSIPTWAKSQMASQFNVISNYKAMLDSSNNQVPVLAMSDNDGVDYIVSPESDHFISLPMQQDPNDNTKYTLDLTWRNLLDALTQGKRLRISLDTSSSTTYKTLELEFVNKFKTSRNFDIKLLADSPYSYARDVLEELFWQYDVLGMGVTSKEINSTANTVNSYIVAESSSFSGSLGWVNIPAYQFNSNNPSVRMLVEFEDSGSVLDSRVLDYNTQQLTNIESLDYINNVDKIKVTFPRPIIICITKSSTVLSSTTGDISIDLPSISEGESTDRTVNIPISGIRYDIPYVLYRYVAYLDDSFVIRNNLYASGAQCPIILNSFHYNDVDDSVTHIDDNYQIPIGGSIGSTHPNEIDTVWLQIGSAPQ